MSWCNPDCFVVNQCVREREAGTEGGGLREGGGVEREREWERESGRGRGRRGDGEGTERGGARGDRERERETNERRPLPQLLVLYPRPVFSQQRATGTPRGQQRQMRRRASSGGTLRQ